MNPEKLKKLQAQAALVRIGGKGELTFFAAFYQRIVFVVAKNIFMGMTIFSFFRHSPTQEEDCSSVNRNRRQEIAVDPQETRC